VVRGDLVDRSIFIDMPVLKERKSSEDADKEFNVMHPKLLGSLLDYTVDGLRNKVSGKVIKTTNTRMADFAQWVKLCLSEDEGKQFDEAYDSNKNAMIKSVSEGDLFIDTLIGFMGDSANTDDAGNWQGTASQLLDGLNSRANLQFKPKGWPANGIKMSSKLNQFDLQIRSRGLVVERIRQGNDKILKISHATG